MRREGARPLALQHQPAAARPAADFLACQQRRLRPAVTELFFCCPPTAPLHPDIISERTPFGIVAVPPSPMTARLGGAPPPPFGGGSGGAWVG